jgi:hypothetical protein
MAEMAGTVILRFAEKKAFDIEAEAKKERPWNDQTGAAKAELSTSVSNPRPNIVRISLIHGVEYGVFLELAREKKYAIIEPTLNKMAPEAIEELKDIMKEMVII